MTNYLILCRKCCVCICGALCRMTNGGAGRLFSLLYTAACKYWNGVSRQPYRSPAICVMSPQSVTFSLTALNRLPSLITGAGTQSAPSGTHPVFLQQTCPTKQPRRKLLHYWTDKTKQDSHISIQQNT